MSMKHTYLVSLEIPCDGENPIEAVEDFIKTIQGCLREWDYKVTDIETNEETFVDFNEDDSGDSLLPEDAEELKVLFYKDKNKL